MLSKSSITFGFLLETIGVSDSEISQRDFAGDLGGSLTILKGAYKPVLETDSLSFSFLVQRPFPHLSFMF